MLGGSLIASLNVFSVLASTQSNMSPKATFLLCFRAISSSLCHAIYSGLRLRCAHASTQLCVWAGLICCLFCIALIRARNGLAKDWVTGPWAYISAASYLIVLVMIMVDFGFGPRVLVEKGGLLTWRKVGDREEDEATRRATGGIL